MKKFNNVIRLLLVVLPFSLTSCEKLENEVKEFFDIDTDKDKQEEYVDSQTAMLQKVEAITKTVGEIYMESSSAAEMKSQSSVIKGIDGVESVWADDLTVFVKIKDFGTVPFVFTPLDNESNSYTRKAEEVAKTRATLSEEKIHNHLDLKEVCIVNQQYNDEKHSLAAECADAINDDFSKCGFYVTVNNRPSVRFFAEDMFNYDLLYLITPGCYNEREGQHWLFTGEEVAVSEKVDLSTLKTLLNGSLKDYNNGTVGIGAIKETRNKKVQTVYYLIVSEELIAYGSNKQFEKPALVFNAACQSVKSNTDLAKAFIQKKAAVYIGYSEKNSVGKFAGAEFCRQLLTGLPVGYIIENFPDSYLTETIDGVTAKLKLYYNDGYSDSYALFCLQHPELAKVDNASTEQGLKVTMQGKMKTPDGYNTDFLSYFTYGFCIGETPNFKEARVMEGLHIGDAGISYVNNQITFEQTFDDDQLKSSTDYYCWAYYYDGVNYCVSDSMTFTTPYRPAPSIEEIVTPEYTKYIQVIHDTVEIVDRSALLIIISEKEYIPVFVGDNPPNIEGTYLISPCILTYTTHGYKPGDKFLDMYIDFYNQKRSKISFRNLQQGSDVISMGEGDGIIDVYVTGFREYFTVYLRTKGVSSYWDSEVYSSMVEIYSGRKTERGIEDLSHCFLMVDKGLDPYEHLVPVGTYRKFYDGDGFSEYTTWPTYSRTRSERPKGTVVDTPWSIYSTGK